MEQESCARALEGDVARSLCVPQPAPPAQFHAPPTNGLVVPQVLARCVSQTLTVCYFLVFMFMATYVYLDFLPKYNCSLSFHVVPGRHGVTLSVHTVVSCRVSIVTLLCLS